MDPRLLRLYSDELVHLRERGAEFAREFPKIASRLSMDGVEVNDPYVERLLEGFAFLTARIQLKLDAEYPRLVQHLLEAVYPNFLAPIPSMMVVQLVPDASDPNLVHGARVRRGSSVRSGLPRGQNTLCEFRTAHEVRLWPIEIASAQYFSVAPDLPLSRLPGGNRAKGGLRIRLRALSGASFRQLAIDSLLYAAMWYAYERTRGAADALGFPLQVESMRDIDRFLFLGNDPNVVLQQHFWHSTVRWWDVAVTPIGAPPGCSERILAVSRDITELKLTEARQTLLMQELAHRMKNTLALVQAVDDLMGFLQEHFGIVGSHQSCPFNSASSPARPSREPISWNRRAVS